MEYAFIYRRPGLTLGGNAPRIPYMFRRLSFSLLLVLALLQCLAPLLHAHYSGLSPADGIHLHALPDLEHGHGPAGVAHIEDAEAPAVDFADGFTEAGAFAVAPPGLNFLWPAVLAASFLIFRSAARRNLSFRSPPAQAPPLRKR